MNTFRNPASVASPIGRYSHSVEIPANARTVLVSGQIGCTPDGTVPNDYFEQLHHALRNVVLNVEAAGMTVRDIVKCNLLAVAAHRPSGEDARSRGAAVLDEVFGTHVPCWTTQLISGLVRPDLMLEVEAIAASTDNSGKAE
ncbi:RidA family protein [Ramlibacter humi]|uniref:RidA family protein n=1 Tax=Ramlibacter humi TaxID=2530451 RepID=A0A4Z0CAT9_9BURK|nr:RidA family protein [Ramlibacter humi]TFZ08777.1 RidA family protein [Ramlibacter humi]